MNELALFAGAGGGILGGHMLGWTTVCAVERDAYAASVLVARQNDGSIPPFPIWDDVCTFDGKPWRGVVDVVSGGFPCQDISINGKGNGIEGERSGLWSQMVRIIREVAPSVVFVENSPALTVRGLGTVLADLAKMGFDAEWGCVSAEDTGAMHRRERIWIVAYAAMPRRKAHAHIRDEKKVTLLGSDGDVSRTGQRWGDQPGIHRVANGVANRVDRVKCLGNGQVPRVAAAAFRILSGAR
jgi:DNA (cytosine-5)-methyltransferase 1